MHIVQKIPDVPGARQTAVEGHQRVEMPAFRRYSWLSQIWLIIGKLRLIGLQMKQLLGDFNSQELYILRWDLQSRVSALITKTAAVRVSTRPERWAICQRRALCQGLPA